ncbi:hypothetical protein [Rhodococcus sp. SJ-3]|uniref:hypothetical protein n=1 Tax=Rhodococcus sp. SJ-3 TaxID=3454628 RepID=UPI003F795FE1
MAQVLVKKNSWEHTEIQWDQRAREQCRESGAGADTSRRPGAPRPTCPSMLAAITRAAAEGLIDVVDDAPVPAPILH